MRDETQTGPPEGKDRSFVTALARGLEILRCFRDGEMSLSNSDFSERTGLPKATISRLTHTLCALDYLVAEQRSGTYRLSAGVLHLGFGVLSAVDIGARAQPEMQRLRDGPNSYITAALGEQHQRDVVYLATCNSYEGVSLAIRVGTRLPLFQSAMGQAILVGMSEAARAPLIDQAQAEGLPAKRLFAEARAVYEAKGFCTGYGTWRADVNGIAVPARALSGSRVYGLNVGGPSHRVKPRQLEGVYAPMLQEAAHRLSLTAPDPTT
ncbi:MAG: IclR family transcriptional regulator [Pseudomonadota bacterium]